MRVIENRGCLDMRFAKYFKYFFYTVCKKLGKISGIILIEIGFIEASGCRPGN